MAQPMCASRTSHTQKQHGIDAGKQLSKIGPISTYQRTYTVTTLTSSKKMYCCPSMPNTTADLIVVCRGTSMSSAGVVWCKKDGV